MKLLLSLTLALAFGSVFSQTQPTTTTLFAQCMFDIQDQQEILDLEEQIRLHPNANVVRLDWHTQRAFILTMGIDTLTEQEFRSWFGSEGNDLTCIQIGVHGVDTVEPYPFTNCQD